MKTSRFTALTFQAGEKSKQQSIAIFCVQSEYYKREGNLSANSGSLTLTALVVKGLQMSASTLQTQTAGLASVWVCQAAAGILLRFM